MSNCVTVSQVQFDAMTWTCDGSWASPCVIFDNLEHQISEVGDIRLQEVDRRGFLDVSGCVSQLVRGAVPRSLSMG